MQLFRYASSMRSVRSGARLPGRDFVCLHVFANNINSLLTCIKLTKTLLIIIITEKPGCKIKINNYCFLLIFLCGVMKFCGAMSFNNVLFKVKEVLLL